MSSAVTAGAVCGLGEFHRAMPHADNIDAPITLVGFGRSGTSLLSSLFDIPGRCHYLGETNDFIYGVWDGLETRFGTMAPQHDGDRTLRLEERAANAVRSAFLATFPDHLPFWFHKPIGVPRLLSTRYTRDDWNEAAEWYWRVQKMSFPRAKYFTVIRHPCDVVLSAKDFWHSKEQGVWWALGFLAHLITHPSSPVEYAVFYDDLVAEPQATVESLFQYLGLEPPANYLSRFETVHAAAPSRREPGTFSYSRRGQWAWLDSNHALPEFREKIKALHQRFGRTLTYPRHLERPPDPVEVLDEDPSRKLLQEQSVEEIHRAYQKKFRNRECEYNELWRKQQAWISELEQAKSYLEGERDQLLAENQRFSERIGELEHEVAALKEQGAVTATTVVTIPEEAPAFAETADAEVVTPPRKGAPLYPPSAPRAVE